MAELLVNLGDRSYQIHIYSSFDEISDTLKFAKSNCRVLVVTDTNVDKFHSDALIEHLRKLKLEVFKTVIQAGEESKNLDTVVKIYELCREKRFERKDVIIALGGGVIGDIAGFAASTYLRGINFVQIPTTIIAVSDSSVGGKTGVDFGGSKNLVGAFYQPKSVFINVSTLKTLPEREYISGFAEVVKHAVIERTVIQNCGENIEFSFFEYLEENVDKILSRDIEVLSYMIKVNCLVKAKVIELDERESNLRAVLNYGHTIGHAIESSLGFKLYHGECVSLGMVAADNIAVRLGLLSRTDEERINKLLLALGLPTSYSGLNVDEIVTQMQYDKKISEGKINFILPKKIGEVVQCNEVDEGTIKDAVKQL